MTHFRSGPELASQRVPTLLVLSALLALLAGCGSPALREADELRRSNQLPQAWMVLDKAAAAAPEDQELRRARLQLRDQLGAQLVMQIEGMKAAGRWDAAKALTQRLAQVDPKHVRLPALELDLRNGQRHEGLLQQARELQKANKLDLAEARAREILAENPGHPGARAVVAQLAQARPLETPLNDQLGPAFQKPVSLEFRDAPLRQVFESLSRSSNVNFVFDKDVRSDARVTIFLRSVTLDEAIRVILTTQQLDRKLLNDSSLLIFPATAAKQREHQELVTRTFYVTNADVKQVQAMVKTIAKVRDVHIDERLNLLVVRDTAEVMRLVEKLIASIDLAEPEVMLDVEIMELSTDRVEALGLQWPETVQYGLPGATGQALLGQRGQFAASVANPVLLATLRGAAGNANLLSNPKIRVRNRDKATVHVGEKLPVFTSTTAVNIGVSSSVNYLEIGLKLEVEPIVQLDNDVTIKLGMEVSNVIRQVTGPAGAVAYEIGTRKATTSLRLADGETQILAGLIKDEDRSSSNGIPGISRMPLLGRLFGLHTDSRNKTEVVLLITPRIVRNLNLPEAGLSQMPSGTDASPGAFSTKLGTAARAGVGFNPAGGAGSAPPPAEQMQAVEEARVRLDVTPNVSAGGTVSVSVKNESRFAVAGELEFDASMLTVLGANAPSTPGRIPLDLAPGGDRVLLMRALPAAAGQTVAIDASRLTVTAKDGKAPALQIDGAGRVIVEAAR